MTHQNNSDGLRRDYREELVFTESTDSLPLEGALIAPQGDKATDLAVVWIHGGASKFYERHYVAIGRDLATRGYPFLTGNTRGHDGFTLLLRRRRDEEIILGGGSFERFDESPRDLESWVDFAMTLGVGGVVLAGHSLGASTVVYYQAQRQDPRVLGVVAASPPEGWQSNPARVALASKMVAEGRGAELLPHLEGSPAWNIVSAQMVLTRDQVIRHAFESDSEVPHIALLRCPILVLCGAEEEVDAAWIEKIQGNVSPDARIDVRLVPEAKHEYAGQEAQAAGLIASWIESIAGSATERASSQTQSHRPGCLENNLGR